MENYPYRYRDQPGEVWPVRVWRDTETFEVSEKEVGGTLMARDHRREVRIFASEHLFK